VLAVIFYAEYHDDALTNFTNWLAQQEIACDFIRKIRKN